jgi:hypothetical protein
MKSVADRPNVKIAFRVGLFLHVLLGVSLGCADNPIADQPTDTRAEDGRFIHWVEHRIDDSGLYPNVALRGADGLEMADLDGDGAEDLVSVHEDSDHLRLSFATDDPDVWHSVTLDQGARVAGAEDPAIGDLDHDGDLDLIIACEGGTLVYFENPGGARARDPSQWIPFIPPGVEERGSWIRVYVADLDRDGDLEVIATNKSIPMPGGYGSMEVPATPVSVFQIDGDPLDAASWHEFPLSHHRVPVNSRPIDLDGDGDLEVLIGSRGEARMLIAEDPMGPMPSANVIPIEVDNPHRLIPRDIPKRLSGFEVATYDLNGDGRLDLITSETPWSLVWLEQPEEFEMPWRVHRIVSTYPDSPTAISLVDINGDGRVDIFSGGYSEDPRETEVQDPGLLHRAGGLFWFEQPTDPTQPWQRHDISRRVRGMYDVMVPRDLNGDGLIDFVGTRGNSGVFDGVIWIEQQRSKSSKPRFAGARSAESRQLAAIPGWIRALARFILL